MMIDQTRNLVTKAYDAKDVIFQTFNINGCLETIACIAGIVVPYNVFCQKVIQRTFDAPTRDFMTYYVQEDSLVTFWNQFYIPPAIEKEIQQIIDSLAQLTVPVADSYHLINEMLIEKVGVVLNSRLPYSPREPDDYYIVLHELEAEYVESTKNPTDVFDPNYLSFEKIIKDAATKFHAILLADPI